MVIIEWPWMYECADEVDMRSEDPYATKSSQREEWAGKEGKDARRAGALTTIGLVVDCDRRQR
jgi:hypothetical protein